jgi:MFS family permease
MLRPRDEAELEQVEDALVDGDVAYQRGTAQAALRHRDFRIVYAGTFASNVGTWMQNVILGAYMLDTTGKGSWVSLVFFAQLGPLLFLSLAGGALADTVDRRRLLVTLQLIQGILSLGLAAIVWTTPSLSPWVIVAIVFAIGIANALGAPGLSSILPTLVPREDMPGAVALMSVQMNLSRVIGPAIGGLIYTSLDAGPVFAINAATYLFAVTGLVWARYAARANSVVDERGIARLLSGARIARRDPLIRHVLVTLATFSFFSLPFVGIMGVIAKFNLGIAPKSGEFGLLYATFGLGAALGAVTVGTVLATRSKVGLLRVGFFAFAIVLAAFAVVRNPALAFPVVALLGYVYFLVVTCLSTVLQDHLPNEVRGRVMALWIMGFGGTVPLGVLAAGPFSEHHSTEVLLVGAAWALVLALWSNAERLRRKGASDV